MASTVQYGMGQLRYTNTSSYMTNRNFSYAPIKTAISSSQDTSEESLSTEYYQDVYLSGDNNFNFVAGVPYLLHLDIPKDLSYDCVYQIKMITAPLGNTIDTTNLTYQMIKYITVPKSVGIGNTSRIIIYPVNSSGEPGLNEDNSYITKVAISKTLNEQPVEDDVIFDESTGRYYVYDGSEDSEGMPIIGTSVEIYNKNDTIMEHTWAVEDITTETVGFDIIFTPRNNSTAYAGIFIQMVRSSLDYDIYSETDNIFGRRIDLNNPNWSASVYELTNLISSYDITTPIINIGVYSHPNLLMAINGEEIKVGQSGYYELNDFEITSLAIAASDINDKFTLDYQYKNTID